MSDRRSRKFAMWRRSTVRSWPFVVFPRCWGKIVTILAPTVPENHATQTVSGVMDPEKGQILLNGEEIQGREPDQIVRRCCARTGGRGCFPS